MAVVKKVSPKNIASSQTSKDKSEVESVSQKAIDTSKAAEEKIESKKQESAGNQNPAAKQVGAAKKACAFCKSKLQPAYWDAAGLRRFVSDRGRIVPRTKSYLCAKHQRKLSREIKRARHLALLPFVIKI